MGRHHNPSRLMRYTGGAAGIVLIFAGLFGAGFSIGEAKAPDIRTVTETETVTEYRVPTECLDALDAAANGLDLAGDYDDEMRTLHARDGGVHIFTPGDSGGHYEVAQQHHKDLATARRAFDEVAAQCRGGS